MLVGAPAADSGQPGVQEGGAVYKCRPESPNQCEIIPFDREGKQIILYSTLNLKCKLNFIVKEKTIFGKWNNNHAL